MYVQRHPTTTKMGKTELLELSSEEDSFPIGGQVTVVRAIGRVMMGKLWFLGMNVAQGEPETKQFQLFLLKLVTKVSEQFYNTYRSSSPNNVMKKRNLDDSDDKYFGFDYEIQPCITNNLLRITLLLMY